ncbi:hypothetical protein AVEN_206581-1 [Araneus ventricosus]|uniref:Uncharacterized protein n=1 Tax=Araneus ventricosus TaxID=182803 RepID=A0A4Y2PCC0_ARAVE|nr:hypothetical protein AVEN_206581-1 [Araneus ventricosus]
MTLKLFIMDELIEEKSSGANLIDDEIIPPSFKDAIDFDEKLRTHFFCQKTSEKTFNEINSIHNAVLNTRILTLRSQLVWKPAPAIREDAIFFSQHGPFPAYLKRFHLSDSDYCSCSGIGTALHYATECIYTVSWHMRNSEPNFEQEWLKRVANNLVSRQKIRGIIKFISENRDLFRPP